MSEVERLESDLYWIRKMIEYAEKSYSNYQLLEELQNTGIDLRLWELAEDGLASNLSHVGEQIDSNKLSKELQEEYHHIDWSNIKRYRDLHDHLYEKIKIDQVYEIIEELLPSLVEDLYRIEKDLLDRLSEF